MSKFYDDDALFSFNFNWEQPRITSVEELTVLLGWDTDNPEGGALIELIDVWEDPVWDGQRHSPGRGS